LDNQMPNTIKIIKSQRIKSHEEEEVEDDDDGGMEIDLSALLGGGESGSWSSGHNAYFGPETRTLTFSGDVGEEKASAFCSQLLALAEQYPDIPIVVHVNTYGGSVSAALTIYDTMKIISCPVITIAKGSCMSAGLIILLGGDVRLSYPKTRFMYHEVISITQAQTLRQAEAALREYKLALGVVNEIVHEHCVVSPEDWKFYFSDNLGHYFDADKALSWGFVQDILPYANKGLINGQ